MNPVLIQKQVRENAEDLHNYMLDLKSWESEMKRKESELKAEKSDDHTSPSLGLPPIRSKKNKGEKKINKRIVEAPTSQPGAITKKIAGFDYASWDRFDVDKACNEVDETSEESEEEETESEEEALVDEERLREEALYEKEKGNQFVKKQKWTEAIQCYSRAIECFPHDAIYYANRALCYLKTNNLESAEADCTSSLMLDSNYVKAYQRRAAARIGLGCLLEAEVDLKTVLELEPMNTASKVELIKLVKLIDCSQAKSVDLTSSGERSENVPLPQQSNVGSGEAVNVKMSWGSEEGIKLVQPINKPPHLRSKKPLQRIQIQEFGEGTAAAATTTTGPTSERIQGIYSRENELKNVEQAAKDVRRIQPADVNTRVVEQIIKKSHEMERLPVRQSEENDDQVPGRPRSSVDFLVGWKKVRSNLKLAFTYLKQIPGEEIPKIFRESFDSATFTEIISVLNSEFLKSNVPVYPYLLGMSNVKRLSALTMFMSNVDKAGLNELFESSVARGECNQDEAKMLKEKFEL